MGKWEPVQPSDLKPGDKVKAVQGSTAVTGVVGVEHPLAEPKVVDLANSSVMLGWDQWQWFRRQPAKPARPVEPPAGTVVRNTRSGAVGKHFAPLNDDDTRNWPLLKIDGDWEWKKWDDFIAPGDAIEVAEWVKPA